MVSSHQLTTIMVVVGYGTNIQWRIQRGFVGFKRTPLFTRYNNLTYWLFVTPIYQSLKLSASASMSVQFDYSLCSSRCTQ